jgi:hypothetical protein
MTQQTPTPPTAADMAWVEAMLAGRKDEARRIGQLLDVAAQLENTSHTDLGAAALRYAEAGIRVFPVKPKGKAPLTLNGLHDASADLALVTSWWTRWPHANIGLPTGLTFDVFDLDGQGAALLWARGYFENLEPFLGHVLTPRTASHHLYVPTTGRGNGTDIAPAVGVDYRGLGGYVVAPPSLGDNGRRYVWLWPLEALKAGRGR